MPVPAHPRHTSRNTLLAGIAAGALIAGAAQAADDRPINLPAGSLEASLRALSAQTGDQLLFPLEAVAGRQAPAVQGRLTVEAALDRLLADSDLLATRAGPRVIVLRARSGAAGRAVGRAPEGAAPRPFGETGEAPATSTGPVMVDEVRVTGSHIRGAPASAPLLALDREAIDRSGRATVAEALTALPQNFSGIANEGAVTTGADTQARNAGFASAVNLRGLGADATLVLVNGRRMAGSGIFGDFADVSSIPTAAVARVDVLLDGASAIYGSDAVGGVVNIILRRDFEGAETRLFAGVGTRGEPYQQQASQTFGRRWDGGGVLVSLEYQKREALSADARTFAADADLRRRGGRDQRSFNAFPGNILRTDPATGGTVPGWAIPAGQPGVGLRPTDFLAGGVNLDSLRRGVDLLPRQMMQAAYVALDQAVGERLELSGDFRYSFRRFAAYSQVPTSTLTVTRANPFFVSPNGAASHSIAYSFQDQLPNSRNAGSAESLSTSFGGVLKLGRGWRADGYVAFAQEIEEARVSGLVNSAALTEALGSVADRPDTAFSTARDGFFNPFAGQAGANSAGLLAYIGGGFTQGRFRIATTSANLQADGPLLALPGGDLKIALGGHARRETLFGHGANFTSTTAPTPQRGTDVSREVVAAFAELRAPIVGQANRRRGIEQLELSLAGRVEHYDDVGTTANPKVGVVWSPTEALRLRGTWGTSFRAPALREVYDAPINSSAQFPLGAARIRGLLLGGGNLELKPQTATSWTLGFDLRPQRWPGLTLSATLFDVRFEDRIGRPVQANALNALVDPTLAPFVRRISPATNAADLQLITTLLADPATNTSQGIFPPEAYGAIVDNRYVNTASLHVRGIDGQASYAFDLGADRIALAANVSYMARYRQKTTPTTPAVDRAGVANFPVNLRGRMTADWTRGPVTAGIALNYVGRYRDSLGGRIADQATLDAQLRLTPREHGVFAGLGATLAVRNLFDAGPPFYDNPAGLAYDPANADPIGRFVSLRLTRRW